MDRRTFITNVACGLVAVPLATQAQQAGRIYRIGYLSAAAPAASATVIDAFRQGLRERGWVEGQSFVIDYRFAEGRYDRLPDLAAELVRLNMDVIVAAPTPPAMAASKATRTIPIVMIGVNDPVGLGLVTSLARPGGNVTGPSAMSSDFATKRLELFKQAIPSLNRVGVLSTSYDGAAALASWNGIEAAASQAGLQIQRITARDPADFENAFATVAKEKINGLLIINDPRFVAARNRLAELALRNRVPTMFEEWRFVEAGGLIAYGPSYPEIFRSAARYVDKILKGAKPADLPVEQPSKFELVINLKTAQQIGVTIPPNVLVRADRVIK
jgi:ABC-type uncharacterized transport system substrate-binding protein